MKGKKPGPPLFSYLYHQVEEGKKKKGKLFFRQHQGEEAAVPLFSC